MELSEKDSAQMSEHKKEESRPAYSTSLLFTESGVKFLATYRIWIVAAVWLAVRGYVIWGMSPNYSIESYLKLAGDWLDGYTPYADFKTEYPPGALLLFILPRIFTEVLALYGYIFASVLLLADLGILLFFWRIPALVRAGEVKTDMARRYESTLLCLTYIVFTAVFGRLLFQNYDLIIGLLLAASVYFALRKKAFVVDALVAVGIWLNLATLIWIPLLWWYGFVSRDEAALSQRSYKISEIVRALLPRAAVLAGSLGVLFLPFFILSGRSLDQIVRFHLERGTQLESTAAGILMLGAKIFGFGLSTEFTHRAIHLSGELGSQGAVFTGIFSIIVFVILTIYLARMIQNQSDAQARRIWLIRGLLATVLALLATSKAFLPQYLLWVCPLAAFLAHDHQPRISRVGWCLFAANLISSVVFFFFYPDLIEMHFLPGVLLLIRNLLMVWLVVFLLLPDTPAADQRVSLLRIAPSIKKYLIWVPMVLLFAWGMTAAFRPVWNNDIWYLFREAGDIVASGEIPRVDQYSAVAVGRPYLAHEWLSGLIFLGIFKLGGGEALTVFRTLIMLAILLLLWFSLEKRARSFVLTALLLTLAAYIILERMFVRPHAFTLLFLCIWVFSLERWRRQRRLRYLIILVPLQILWANLHGGYIIALVLGVMMTGSAALLVMFPSWSKDESYDWSDVLKLAILTVACLAASLVNPHGLRLLEFSLTLSLASDYIKQFIYEWRSPLAASYMSRAYGSDVALSIFILMWLGLVLNVKRRPLVDAVFALLATVITVQAIRFVSFIGILGFPLTVRAWLAVADTHAKSLLVKRRPLLEAALFAFILASTLVYGFPLDKVNHRKIDWGFGGRLPYETVDFMVEQGFEGVIFNDYSDGGFIQYRLAPRILPVMDSRIDVYGSELTHEYFSSRDDPENFFQYLNKYNVSFILLMQTKKNIPVIQLLLQLPAAKPLLRADGRFLFSYNPDLLPSEFLHRQAF
jgi:hypothetical protein